MTADDTGVDDNATSGIRTKEGKLLTAKQAAAADAIM